MRGASGRLATIAACGGLLACAPSHEIVTACRDANGAHPVCGFQNPEDLALLPDGRTLVVSQFGGMEGERPGSLALFDLVTEELRVAHVGHAAADGSPPRRAAGWGDAACPGPPPAGFAPHGIDVAPRPDDRLRLLVVNHGGREAIETFEIVGTGRETEIVWRGCAIPPEDAFLNDVVALPDGGLLVTHMMDRDAQTTDVLLSFFGVDTGFVYAWSPGDGFRVVPGTEGPFPNGIELSDDGADVYLNLYLGNEVRRIVRATGEVLAVADVRQPDNSSWARDGRLLVASHVAGFADATACWTLERGACPFAFEIVALDPKTLEREVVHAGEGEPMGAATIAVDTGRELILGSFAGDRIVRVRRGSTD